MQNNLSLESLRTPRERTLKTIALVFSALAWIALVVTIVGAFYGVLIAAVIAMAHALFLAHVRGNGVRVGPNQLPDIWERTERAAQMLGLREVPAVYVIQSGGILNAFATKLLSRRYVVLHSELVDACLEAAQERGAVTGDTDELDFVIGHELAHIAFRHLSWVVTPARAIPLLGAAYSRACEYSCDRCGHAVVGDLAVSSRALAILAVGGRCAARMNLDAFVEQREEAGHFWMAIYELNASHPYLPKRVAALREHEVPGSARPVGRNRVAYPLAPFLAFGSGAAAASGLMMVVAVMGIMAAVAVPAFMKYQKRSRDAQIERAFRMPSSESYQITGKAYPWTMSTLEGWSELPGATARQHNPLADRWFTRSDSDAQLAVIAEPTQEGMTLDSLEASVLANAKAAMKKLDVVERRRIGQGRLVVAHVKLKNGDKLVYRYGLFVGAQGTYQVVAFAPPSTMPFVEADIDTALATFSPR